MRVVGSALDRAPFPLESELAWKRDAACRGLSSEESQAIFFPAPGGSIDEARRICSQCPVSRECLNFAVTNSCVGVWAGTTERHRRRLRHAGRGLLREVFEPTQ